MMTNSLNYARSIAKFTKMLQRQMLTDDEYFYNVLNELAATDADNWPDCVRRIPADKMHDFLNYCDHELVGVDFWRSSHMFVVDHSSEDQLRAKAVELRPKYKKLWEFLRSEVSAERRLE